MKKVYVKKNRYVDSVTLMGTAEKIMRIAGVRSAESGMGTQANCELLQSLGYSIPQGIGKQDLIIAVDAENDAACDLAYEAGMAALHRRGGGEQATVYRDLEALPRGQYDIAQISLPGEYAAAEIKRALRLGMDVFAFSDNVSIEEERACKELGQQLGKLVMGPDAGVGLIGGVALAAGSIVRPGGIGIVGASGSGAQEVACLIEQLGAGVSAIIGTGGRDLRAEIGGITMRMGMDRLNADDATRVICLVSKMADDCVMREMLIHARTLCKPVVAVFLGCDPSLYEGQGVHGAQTLQQAAEQCHALLTGTMQRIGHTTQALQQKASTRLAALDARRRYFRGLYCGGTFAEEALMILAQEAAGIPLHSNLHTRYAAPLASAMQSMGHTLLDLGAEDFTASAPHPVFDPTLRLRRLETELADEQVAVMLLDFITGPGVHPDPIMPFVPLIAAHPNVLFIATICGAQGDPQSKETAKEALSGAGAMVAASNAQSAMLAAFLLLEMERRDAS